jgi:hypothetical protein
MVWSSGVTPAAVIRTRTLPSAKIGFGTSTSFRPLYPVAVDSTQVFATMPTRMMFSIPPLGELGVEIGMGEAALPPVLQHDDVTIAGTEFGMERSAPTAGGEALALVRPNLSWVHMLPPLVVAFVPKVQVGMAVLLQAPCEMNARCANP